MTAETHTQISAEELAHAFEEPAPDVDLRQYAIEDWASFALFWLMAFAVFLQFFTRYVSTTPRLDGGDRNLLPGGSGFHGAAMCVRLGRHIHVDLLFRYLPAGGARALAIDDRCSPHGVLRLRSLPGVAVHGDRRGRDHDDDHAAEELVYGCVFVGFILMFIRSVQVSIENWRRGYSILERPEAFDAAPT